jgi:hypothetical protein
VSIEGVRFEVPNRFRHIERVHLRYARWDLSGADVVDQRTGAIVATIYPVNKIRNAEGTRRRLEPIGAPAPQQSSMAPLLKKLLADYAAAGVPPAYIPKEESR